MPEVNIATRGDGGQPRPQFQRISDERPPPRSRLTTDDLVDSALDKMAQEPPPAGKPKGAPSTDEIVDELADELGVSEEGDPQEEPQEPAEDDADGEVENDTGYGSRDRPYKLSDLPKDKFIELKVEGEKIVVPVSELGRSWIAEKTFQGRISRVQDQTKLLEQLVTQAREVPDTIREKVHELFNNPEDLYKFMLSKFEPTLHALAQRRAKDILRWQQNPHERVEFERQRGQAELEARQNAFNAQQEVHRRTQQQQAAIEQRTKVLKPGFDAGLKEAGYPQIDAEFTDTVGALIQRQIETTGQPVTADDVRKFVVRVAKLLDAKPVGKRKPPPPIIDPKARAQRPNGKAKDYSGMSQQQRMRDPDFFLQGVKTRG